MRPVAKAALFGFAVALAVFVTFTVPQVFRLWLKQAGHAPPDARPFPVSAAFSFASFPSAVAGTLAFVLFWLFFVRLARDARPPPGSP